MARRSIRSRTLLPLLSVLFLGTAAAATPEQGALQAARKALDRAEYEKAQTIIKDALSRFGQRDSEAVWALRIMQLELATTKVDEIPAFTLPPKYAYTETGVRYWMMRAFYDRDVKLLDRAERLAAKHHPAMLAEIYFARSSINWDLSDGQKALDLARAHKLPVIEAKAMTNLTAFLLPRSEYAEAVRLGEQAVALAKEFELPKLQQAAEGNLGWAYFELGDYVAAEQLFSSAERTARQIGAKRDHPIWLLQLGNIEFQKRNWKRAAEYNQQAAALAKDNHDKKQLGYALANLARTAIEQHRYDVAAAFNQQALEAKKGNTEAVLSSRVVDARIAAHKGETARARKLFESVIAESTTPTLAMEAETYLASMYVSTGHHEKARRHFERAVRIARDNRGKVKDAELRFSFFNTVETMYDAYVDFLVQTGYIYRALAVAESSRAQSLGDGRNVALTFDPRPIAKACNATILSYWLGRERSYVWVVTPDAVKARALPPDTSIENLTQSYRRASLGADARASMHKGKELFRLLVPPVPFRKNGRVIVLADGQLHTLNFETLVTPAGEYWIRDVVLVNAPSLQLAVRAKPKVASPSILLLGDPKSPDPSFPPLEHARAEIDRVGALFDRRTIFQGAEATPEAFKAAVRANHDFVHLAAHGVASRRRPLDSAVILAGRDRNSPYRLLGRDVVQQQIDARLVTISSCHGAGERTYAGEGVVGMAWAFMKAGADQVVAALWEVDDAATPKLMETMYRHIRAGSDPADALRAAKLQLVDSKSVHQNPRYWAPFVLYAGN